MRSTVVFFFKMGEIKPWFHDDKKDPVKRGETDDAREKVENYCTEQARGDGL